MSGFSKVRLAAVAVILLAAMAARAQVISVVHPAPDFPKDTHWLDKAARVPHHIKGYRGQVLLIDFWEYTCINCIRDFTALKHWYDKYHPYGLQILGVHFGEFAMGFSDANVRRAAQRFRLPWPVVSDVHGAIWKAYGSTVWPNRYLIDQQGNVILQIKGEGNDSVMERTIRDLLAKDHPEVKNLPLGADKNAFTPECGVPTPETYVGNATRKGAVENQRPLRADGLTDFHATGEPKDGGVILGGTWRGAQDGAVSGGKDDRAELRYHARSLYAVLSLDNTSKPVRVDVTQDGKPLDRSDAGVDVKFDSNGSYIEVKEPRMYYVIKNPALGSHLLTLAPEKRGVTMHSFTFGNNCQQDFQQL
ncbi:MAG: redoxin domain-containing protein [Chlamydiota bacterium]